MMRTVQYGWKIGLLTLLLVTGFAAWPGPPIEAIPGCGQCIDGTTGEDYACTGPASNCTHCTVCAK